MASGRIGLLAPHLTPDNRSQRELAARKPVENDRKPSRRARGLDAPVGGVLGQVQHLVQ
jgi:hypothetical protein